MNKTPSIANLTANLTANAEANFKNHGSQSGMSLVALLVAIGILGVLSVVISQSFKFNLDESQKISDLAAAEELRQYIRIQIDCAQTIASAPANCNSKTPIALKRWGAGAKDLVQKTNLNTKAKSNSYTEVGYFSLRAYCVGTPNTYNVDYGRTPKNQNSQPNWKPLFKIPVVCP